MAHSFKTIAESVAVTRKRAFFLLLALAIFALYLCSTIFRMQVSRYEYYENKVIDQITTSSALKAKRGTIYDSSMQVLANTETVWRVFLSPVDIAKATQKEKKEYAQMIAKGLSEILHISESSILKKANQNATIDVTIAKEVNEETYKKIQSFIAENNLANMIHTEANTSRFYPKGDFCCHLLGFTGTDGQGLFGLEYQYDSHLKGQDGYYVYAKDATGSEMPSGYISYIEPINGNSLVTTIDSYIQSQLEYQISEIEETFAVQNRVSGIVMDVDTGAILAMATTSSFDLNSPYELDTLYSQKLAASGLPENSSDYKAYRNELLYTMWQNKPVSEAYEPGSTFKIITVSAGLETNSVSLANQYVCNGSHAIGGYHISCHKKTGHGTVTLAQGLQQSCNPCMIMVSQSIGASKFYEYVKAFGYLEKTGIDLPSEGASIFHTQSGLGITELATSSFGQRFKVTPLQQITAIAAVANGGYLVTPYVVEKILDSNGNTVYSHTTQIKRQVISSQTAQTVSKILEEGVSGDGGAKNAAAEGYLVAAKTGTSEKFDILDENGNSYLRIGSCVGYAPSDDAKIAVLIIVDEPTTAKYGSIVAAPYVGNMMKSILPYLGYESASDNGKQNLTIENYVGLSVNEAKTKIEKQGMKVTVYGSGEKILSQMPQCGTEINIENGSIYLYTNDAKEEYVTMPNLIGKTPSSANEEILTLGLNIKLLGVSNYTIGKGATVTSQSIAAGTRIKKGTVIELMLLYTDSED